MKYRVEHYRAKWRECEDYIDVDADSFDDATRVIEEWGMEREDGDVIWVYSDDGGVKEFYVDAVEET